MRRWLFFCLCCLLLCLPAMGEELSPFLPAGENCTVSVQGDSVAAAITWNGTRNALWLFHREGESWQATQNDTLFAPGYSVPTLSAEGNDITLLSLREDASERIVFRHEHGSWQLQSFASMLGEPLKFESLGGDEFFMRASYCGMSLYEYGLRWTWRESVPAAMLSWQQLPRTLYEFFQVMKPAGENTLLVDNADPRDRLHLRTRPDKSAPSLGKYYSGTPVELLDYPNDVWAHVRIGAREGYMLRKYLISDAIAVAAPPVVTIRNASGTGLNLRATPESQGRLLRLLENGERVTVLGITENYLHVQAGTDTGFIKNMGTVPALDYHSSDVQPAFTPRKAMTLIHCQTYLRPHITGTEERGTVLNWEDTYMFTGIYGLFAEIDVHGRREYLLIGTDALNWG